MGVGLDSPAGSGQAPVTSEPRSAGAGRYRRPTAAVAVLYHPDTAVLENLASQVNQFAYVGAVNNSEEPGAHFENRLGSPGKVALGNHAGPDRGRGLQRGGPSGHHRRYHFCFRQG